MSTDIRPIELTIAVPPRKLFNPRQAIEEKLNRLISQYVPEANGVLIKWCDLVVLYDNGVIRDDQPYAFWKVRFTAHVFKPVEGKLVKGRVHRVFKHYFIAKALESFVATVAIPESIAEINIFQNIMVDQEVYFRIMGGAEGAYRGELDDECVRLTVELAKQQPEVNEGNVYDYAKDFEY